MVGVLLIDVDNGTFWSQMQNGVDIFTDVGNSIIKSFVFGAAVMMVALYGIKMNLPYPLSGSVGIRALWLTGMVVVGISVYSIATALFRCSEWQWIKDALGKKKN